LCPKVLIIKYKKKIKDMQIETLGLTPLETQALEALIDGLYAEPGFSDVDANDIAAETGIPTKTLRGVLSSLVKRGIITMVPTNTYGAAEQYVIIYLCEAYWGLHPEWKNEINA
jgi:DNA-binding MarR family transcriptional regulator